MKKTLSFLLVAIFLFAALHPWDVRAAHTPLSKDDSGQSIQTFAPDPARSIVPTATSPYTIDVTRYLAIKVYSTTDGTYYFNSDSTKTYPILGGVDTIIVTANPSITSVVITHTGTLSIQGM